MVERQFQVLDIPLRADVPQGDDDCIDFHTLRLMCPLVLDDPDDDINDLLQARWNKHISGFEVDGEATLTFVPEGPGNVYYDDGEKLARFDEIKFRLEFELEVLADPIRPWAININEWYEAARLEFLEKTTLLRSNVASRAQYNKHFAKAGSRTEGDVCRDSRSGISYFQRWVDLLVLHRYVREAENVFLEALFGADDLRAAMECEGPIGWVARAAAKSCLLERG